MAVGHEFGLQVNIEPMFNSSLVRDTGKAVRLAEQVEGIDSAAFIRELKRIDWDGVMVLESLSCGQDERFDCGVYQPVSVDFKSLPAEGRVCDPAWQSIALAYEVERYIHAAV